MRRKNPGEMKFVDEVVIEVRAGDGGHGCVAFRREKYQPRGGPSGGDGGDGGDVIIRAEGRVGTLLELRYSPLIRAERGQHGMGNDRDGRRGAPQEITVPVGTLVYDNGTGELLADLDKPGATAIAARGGRGGAGNLKFKKPWNRTPREARDGTPGEHRTLRLELKLLADVGIIGVPNVGKSTLISRLSSARPKVADYPFTTLIPNLGVVRVDRSRSFVLADIPGLVRGAAGGAGLGSRFLRHVDRTRALLHLVALTPGVPCDPLEDFEAINRELALHSAELAVRQQIVALNKADLAESQAEHRELARRFQEIGVDLRLISGVSGEGLDQLRYDLWALVRSDDQPDDP